MSERVHGSASFRAQVHALVRRVYRVDVSGLESVPLDGRILLAVRHTGAFRHGGIVAAAVIPRPVTYVGAQFMLRFPGLGPAVQRYGGIFVSGVDLQGGGFLDTCAAVLDAGEVLGVMVDGGEMDRVRGPVKPGAAYLAHRLDARIVPVRVGFHGLRSVRVEVLPPQPPPPHPDRVSVREATAALAALLDP